MNRTSVLPLLLLLPLAACGSDEPRLVSEDEVPIQDTAVAPVVREPFTDVDPSWEATVWERIVDQYDLLLEIPWTANRVSKDPVEAAAPAPLLEVTTLETDGFDRVIFRFNHITAYPGYQVRRVGEGETVSCEGEGSFPAETGPLLLVRLEPVRLDGVRLGVSDTGQTRFGEAGLACQDGTTLTWAARIDGGSELRVLELEEPRRVVVDLR